MTLDRKNTLCYKVTAVRYSFLLYLCLNACKTSQNKSSSQSHFDTFSVIWYNPRKPSPPLEAISTINYRGPLYCGGKVCPLMEKETPFVSQNPSRTISTYPIHSTYRIISKASPLKNIPCYTIHEDGILSVGHHLQKKNAFHIYPKSPSKDLSSPSPPLPSLFPFEQNPAFLFH